MSLHLSRGPDREDRPVLVDLDFDVLASEPVDEGLVGSFEDVPALIGPNLPDAIRPL